MKRKQSNSEPMLDELIDGIRREQLDDAVTEQAAHRVWARICAESPSAAHQALDSAQRIQSCADFQSLIPIYLANRLPEARKMLLEDHLGECVSCRQELHARRSGKVRPLTRPAAVTSPRPRLVWPIAATLVLGVGLGMLGILEKLRPSRGGPRAVVESVEGVLYRVSGQGSIALAAGREVDEGEEVRSAKGSMAVIRLFDGSSIEMGERAGLSISTGWRGATIHLEQGSIIVQAAKQPTGRLYVATRDCLVSVKGTIFAVREGTKGARVSVIQGEVEVSHGRRQHILHRGDQVSTDASLASVSVQDEISWSRNASQYLALLGEFAGLQKQLEAIPGPGLRYNSNLVKLVPENSVLYVAIPNIGSELAEASRIFHERIQESEVLREWWNEQQTSGRSNFDEMIERVQSFSEYLGDEVVIAVAADASGKRSSSVLLAEVHRPGLREFLEDQFRQISSSGGSPAPTLVDNPLSAPAPAQKHGVLVFVKNNMLVAAAEMPELQRTVALIERGSPTSFAQTPFYGAIHQAYQSGAGWLFCANLEQIVANSVHQGEGIDYLRDSRTGLSDVRYLVVEGKQEGGNTESRATLSFSQERRGIASWLAAPGPMGTLDFISPEASFAASFVMKNPRDLVQELFSFAESGDPQFGQGLADFESKTGLSVTEDLAGPVGGEVTFALDGPILPTPSWKFAVEVYDPARLEATIEKLVGNFNSEADAKAGKLYLTQQQAGDRTFYTLRSDKSPFEADYVFFDGYLIAAPNRSLLASSIQNRETGYSLTRSQNFTSRLPRDGYANFSAILYHNLGPMIGSIVDRLASSKALTPAQRESVQTLKDNSAPSLIAVYGEQDQIVAASTGSFFGLDLDTMLGIGGPGPFKLLPLIQEAMNQAQKNSDK